jgi:HAD superfamily phosphoserine phosphatase-like hydrolase
MAEKRKFKAVIFDIDGTLTPEISWTALTRDMGASVEEHMVIYHEHRDGKITYETSKRKLLELWRKTGNTDKNYFETVFSGWPLKDGAKDLIDYLNLKNYLLCLITGSTSLYAEIVAKRLGIKEWFANASFDWDDKGNLIDFHYEIEQEKVKLNQFVEFCRKKGLDPKDCAVVGDGYNDAGLFSLTGNGIAVKSKDSHFLDEIAWKKIENLSEIKDLL